MRVLGGVAHVVVVAGHIQRDEERPAHRPAHVLAVFAHLHLDGDQYRIEATGGFREPRSRILAVEPFVIAGDENELVLQAGELALARREPRIAAAEPAAADVADMHDEIQPLLVHVVDQRVETLHFGAVVGRVAEHAEHQATRRDAGAATEQQRQRQPRCRRPCERG